MEINLKREALLRLKEKLLVAEEQRLSEISTIALEEVHKRLTDKINDRS